MPMAHIADPILPTAGPTLHVPDLMRDFVDPMLHVTGPM